VQEPKAANAAIRVAITNGYMYRGNSGLVSAAAASKQIRNWRCEADTGYETGAEW